MIVTSLRLGSSTWRGWIPRAVVRASRQHEPDRISDRAQGEWTAPECLGCVVTDERANRHLPGSAIEFSPDERVLLLGEPVFSNMADRSGSPASTPAEGGYVPDDPDATIYKNDHELVYRPLEVNGRLVQGQPVCTRCQRVRTTLRWFAEHDCRSADGMQHTLSTFE